MDKIMEKLNKLSPPAVILIASIILGGFYFVSQVNKQRSIERQQEIKIEQEKQDQLAKEFREQQVKEEAEQALDACIANAGKNYSSQWHRECKRLGELTSKCIDIQEINFSDYLDKYGLTPDKYNQQRGLTNTGELATDFLTGGYDYLKRRNDECSCALSASLADSVNDSLKTSKDECLKRYPQ